MVKRPTPPAAEYLARLKPAGQTSTRSLLAKVAAFYNWPSITAPRTWETLRGEDVSRLQAHLQTLHSIATVRRTMAAVRRVIRICYTRRGMPHYAWAQIEDIAPAKGAPGVTGREVTEAELDAMLAACGADDYGRRDAAALVLMVRFGLRRAETIAVRMEDYDAERRLISLIGKGSRGRRAGCLGGARRVQPLHEWIDLRGTAAGPIICQAGPVQPAEGISAARLHQRFHALRKRAGVERCTPHDLRRTFITRALRSGMDLSKARRAAGHRSPLTTAGYDRRAEEEVWAELEAIDGS